MENKENNKPSTSTSSTSTTSKPAAPKTYSPRPAGSTFTPRADYAKKPFNRGPREPGSFTPLGDRKPYDKPSFNKGPNSNSRFGAPKFGNSKFGNSKFGNNKSKFGRKDGKKPFDKPEIELFTEVITVKRVTRVVKGGKRMRFAALVVVGDKKGTIGFANKKGMDFQDAVAKATKKAKENMIKIKINENESLPFTTITKFKSSQILLKPANKGTSLIAGGFVRPVLQLAGIKNIYSKILGSNNKVVGVEAVINALKNYQ